MNKKIKAIAYALIICIGLLGLANFKKVKAAEKIYIKADGSIEPSSVHISSLNNVTYFLTSDINDTEGIVIERDNIVLDGANHSIQGIDTFNSRGIELTARYNITIRNVTITTFYYGIYISTSLNITVSANCIESNSEVGIYFTYSSNNSIIENYVTTNKNGIKLEHSPNNILRKNKMAGNKYNFDVQSNSLPNFVNEADSSNSIDSKPMYYWVNEQNSTIPADAGYVGLINCTNIMVERLNVTNNKAGILLAYTTNSTITRNLATNNYYGIWLTFSNNNIVSENSISHNEYGIHLYNSSDNTIHENDVTANNRNGVWLYFYSSFNTISRNNITNNDLGIRINQFSEHNTLTGNNVEENSRHGIYASSSSFNTVADSNMTSNNYLGIELEYSSNCTIFGNNITLNNQQGINLYASSNNTIFENNVANNGYGIFVYASSSNSHVYHNNFLNNTSQFYTDNAPNFWDNGMEGNYWSDNAGSDMNQDGIGEESYKIDINNMDKFPLMGFFRRFNTSTGLCVNVISNSSIQNFEYSASDKTIKMHIANAAVNQTFGFCRISIPNLLISQPYQIIVDYGETSVLYNRTVAENQTHKWIYFAYEKSASKIAIVPEFPLFMILSIFIIMQTLIFTIYRRKRW